MVERHAQISQFAPVFAAFRVVIMAVAQGPLCCLTVQRYRTRHDAHANDAKFAIELLGGSPL